MEKLVNDMYNIIDAYFKKENIKCMLDENKSITLDKCISCQSDNYFNSTSIDYSCDVKKLIYMIRYMPVHFYEISGFMNLLKVNSFNKATLEILSIGGGSGIDIMALNHWIKNQNINLSNIKKINYTILDKEDWRAIFNRTIEIYKLDNIEVNYNFIGIINNNTNIEKDYDLVIMSYLISELDNNTVNTIANKLNKSKNILINDRNQNEVKDKIKIFINDSEKKYRIHNNKFAGFYYPPVIYDNFSPKTNTKSIGCVIYNDN